MITLAWYNIVAIIVGILFFWKFSRLDADSRYGLKMKKKILLLGAT